MNTCYVCGQETINPTCSDECFARSRMVDHAVTSVQQGHRSHAAAHLDAQRAVPAHMGPMVHTIFRRHLERGWHKS